MIRRSVLIFARLLPLLLLGLPAAASTTLIFPRVAFNSSTFTGLAFVNPTAQPATVTLTAYGTDGVPVAAAGFQNPAQLTVPAGRQVARLLNEIFSGSLDPGFVGWIQATSEASGLTGFFLYLDSSLRFLDGADLPQSATGIVFHSAQSQGPLESEFNILNPNHYPTDLSVELVRPGLPPLKTGTPVRLPSMGITRLAPDGLFGVPSSPPGSYLVVNSTGRIAGFEFVRSGEGDLFGLNAKPTAEQMSRLYIPQFAVLGPWETLLTLVNHSSQNLLLTITAIEGTGRLFAPAIVQHNPVVLAMQAGESFTRNVAQLFGFEGTDTRIGWLKVEATSAGIHGFVSYGLPGTGSLAAVSAMPEAQTEFLFSHIATALGYFTGLSLLNPGSMATTFRVAAFTPEGKMLGRSSGILSGGERLSKLIDELVPKASGQAGGFIWIQSDLPLFATSLFGTDRVLANIPPQPAPRSFVPDAAQPRPQVQPKVAVVQPGKSIQFTSSGFQAAVSWSVNGAPGDDSNLGRVDASGKYSAPLGTAEPKNIRIAASNSGDSAGASVDILAKQEVLSGLGTIQSVAYLSSLRKVFTAEVSGFSTQADGIAEPMADTAGSRIYTTLPTRVLVAEYSGEFIAKMIPFVATGGQEYMLLAARESGQVLRLNPSSGQSISVIRDLTGPTALAFDSTTGELLVADRDVIKSFPRQALEVGLTVSPQNHDSPGWKHSQLAEDFVSLVGLAADSCTGDLYVTEADGRLIGIERTSGEKHVIDSSGRPTSLLGIYRTDVPCPAAFHLLAAESQSARINLFVPASNIKTVWLDNTASSDLVLLPADNTVTASEAVLVGGAVSAGPTDGRLSLIPVPDLYQTPSEVPKAPPANFEDPIGDAFGSTSPRYDIAGLDLEIRNGKLVLTVDLSDDFDILTTHSLGSELTVGIEIDSDQNPATGVDSIIDLLTPYQSGLGVEFGVETEVDPATGTVPLYQLTAPGQGEEIARVPIQVGSRTLTVSIPMSAIDTTSCINLVIEAGYYDQADDIILTDISPNRGHFRVCPQ